MRHLHFHRRGPGILHAVPQCTPLSNASKHSILIQVLPRTLNVENCLWEAFFQGGSCGKDLDLIFAGNKRYPGVFGHSQGGRCVHTLNANALVPAAGWW